MAIAEFDRDTSISPRASAGLCSDCQVIYSNANQDATAQQSQADAALTNGANVLVLDAVDGAAAAVIADRAKQQNVPVIAYDRLITGTQNVDYYISFDNERVGVLQCTALLEALQGKSNPQVDDDQRLAH